MDKHDYIPLVILVVLAVSTLLVIIFHKDRPEHPDKMSYQNVVCDLVYGVQYFEHNGSLTLRVNREGKPIRCYE